MGKLTTYLAILSMIILMFHFAGFLADTPISWLMELLLNPESAMENTLFVTIFASLAAFTTVAIIVIGNTIPDRLEKAAIVGTTSLLFVIGWDLIAIFNVLQQTSYPLALLIVSPLMLIYLITGIEWWRGLTT